MNSSSSVQAEAQPSAGLGLGLMPVYIVDEADGPPVGVRYRLQNGDILWTGEVSHVLWLQQSDDTREALCDEYGCFVIHAGHHGVELLARAAGPEIAMELAGAYAAYLARLSSEVERQTSGEARTGKDALDDQ